MNKQISKSLNLDDTNITFKVGEYAPRANSTIFASMGETVVLATVTISEEDSDRDYLPLSVEFIERFYAGGIISGSRFVKRERFPSEDAILKARMIDRTLRPLFPGNFRKDIQIVITVLSYDEINDPAILGLNAASAAVHISEVPFDGPVAGVRIGIKDNDFILNPSTEILDNNTLDLVVSGMEDRIVMIDAGADEIGHEKIEEAFDFAIKHFKKLNAFQNQLQKEIGKEKLAVEAIKTDPTLKEKIIKKYNKDIDNTIYELRGNVPGEKRRTPLGDIIKELALEHEGTFSKAEISAAVDKIVDEKVRTGILKEKRRPSDRKMDEVRKITCELGILPRTHGSAFFSRGVTQSLSIVTLGSTRLEQTLESFEGEETKRYMHHYNGPSFSVGEAGRYNYYPGRREIGHGALAERALFPVIPSEEEFPYTIRVVSEVLAQQGSSSMAAACSSTLALMDAGVPIKSPVAGIAIGLVTSEDQEKYVLLTDVQDLEDFHGDMDFKVTGTKDGITSMQMDNKLKGINVEILKEALKHAEKAKESVLESMLSVIKKPREQLSKYAPKITTMKINPMKIGDIIGPGGKIIREITEKTGAEIDIKDDGTVHISAVDEKSKEDAINRINDIVEEAEVGKVYQGKVAKVVPYGAFVDVSPSISGLVHVSELSDQFVSDPTKIVKEGQAVKVKVIGVDDEGRVNFSIKRAEEENKNNA